MNRIVDEITLCIFCMVIAAASVSPTALVVSFLCAVTVCCLSELARDARLRPVAALAFGTAICIVPSLAPFCPVVAYALFAERVTALRWIWLAPLLFSARAFDFAPVCFIALMCALACMMSWRTSRADEERRRYRQLRDEMQEGSLALKVKNRDLMERRDYELRLATLSERGRIAREIHDNVGHLLTRSVLQVEAMQVVHADDAALVGELSQVGATLHEALDTVRASVHDLHEDAFDLKTQLEQVIDECQIEQARLSYDVGSMPLPLAYAILAIVKEAVSNAEKHSDATRIDASVIEKPAFYQIIVQDNGSAPSKCDRMAGGGTGGIGLLTMRERVESFDGRFLSEYRNGWRVFASIPKEELP